MCARCELGEAWEMLPMTGQPSPHDGAMQWKGSLHFQQTTGHFCPTNKHHPEKAECDKISNRKLLINDYALEFSTFHLGTHTKNQLIIVEPCHVEKDILDL